VKRAAVLVVAFAIIVTGIVGLISPDGLTTIRRLYFASPAGLYAVAVARVVMGLVVILCAPASRAPKVLRVLGAIMCLQALSAIILGPDRARSVLEWEANQGATVLRIGAAVALAVGGFLAFAVSGRGSRHSSAGSALS
jgi:hypothetical protein